MLGIERAFRQLAEVVEMRADHHVLRAQRRIGAVDDRADVLRDTILEWKELKERRRTLRVCRTPGAKRGPQVKLRIATHDEGGGAVGAWRARTTSGEGTTGQCRNVD